MLAREIGPLLGYWKPIVVSHHMLMGLRPPTSAVEERSGKTAEVKDKMAKTIALKMSKSHPDSAIFMTDSHEDIKRKITKAYCPEGIVEENPILEYYKYILFESLDRLGLQNIVVERPLKYGGAVILNNYENLEKLYREKQIHPLDIKQKAIELLDKLLEPVRKHFEENTQAKELLQKVKSFQITR
jgi:tyrosyl-tRNA synthetase